MAYIVCVDIEHTLLEVHSQIALDIDPVLELDHSVSHFVVHLLHRGPTLAIRVEPGVLPEITRLTRRSCVLFENEKVTRVLRIQALDALHVTHEVINVVPMYEVECLLGVP